MGKSSCPCESATSTLMLRRTVVLLSNRARAKIVFECESLMIVWVMLGSIFGGFRRREQFKSKFFSLCRSAFLRFRFHSPCFLAPCGCLRRTINHNHSAKGAELKNNYKGKRCRKRRDPCNYFFLIYGQSKTPPKQAPKSKTNHEN